MQTPMWKTLKTGLDKPLP